MIGGCHNRSPSSSILLSSQQHTDCLLLESNYWKKYEILFTASFLGQVRNWWCDDDQDRKNCFLPAFLLRIVQLLKWATYTWVCFLITNLIFASTYLFSLLQVDQQLYKWTNVRMVDLGRIPSKGLKKWDGEKIGCRLIITKNFRDNVLLLCLLDICIVDFTRSQAAGNHTE